MWFKKYEQETVDDFVEQTFVLVDDELVEEEDKKDDDIKERNGL